MARDRTIPKVDPTPMTVDDVTNYLRQLIAAHEWFKRDQPRQQTGAYSSYHAFVLEHGRAWTSAKRPRGWRKRRDRLCYMNSMHGAMDYPNLRYVEGYAGSAYSGIVTEHAWLVDENDVVIDLTWRYPEQSAYYGIVIPDEIVRRYVSRNRTYGVLCNDWRLGCPVLEYGRLPTVEELDAIADERRARRRERSA